MLAGNSLCWVCRCIRLTNQLAGMGRDEEESVTPGGPGKSHVSLDKVTESGSVLPTGNDPKDIVGQRWETRQEGVKSRFLMHSLCVPEDLGSSCTHSCMISKIPSNRSLTHF